MLKHTLSVALALALPLTVACSNDGNEGAQGQDGSPGEQGKQGDPGQDGSPGKDGKQGEPGKDGKQGDRGEDGVSGGQGGQGDPGEDGEPGRAGNSVETSAVAGAADGPCGLAGGVLLEVIAADSSVVDSQVLCHGAAGVDGSSVQTQTSTHCGAVGGVQVDVVDAAGVVTATKDVCNGKPGLPGAWSCDANSFGDGMCDAACGAVDPDCSGPSNLFVAPLGKAQEAFLASEPAEADENALKQIFSFPTAVWFTDGTPDDVQEEVSVTMAAAAATNELPVLVPYFLPYRDCAQYSAGGAESPEEYKAWIDGFAEGLGTNQLGTGQAMVILEPDGLGIIPNNTTLSNTEDWCKPTVDGEPAPNATPEVRYELLNYAVDRLSAAGAAVYLDGSHSRWLGVGEAAYRLHSAGVERARGFFVNVSNYQLTDESVQFATWVSSCITAATHGVAWAAGHFDWCPGQYNADLGYAVDYSSEYVETVNDGFVDMMDGHAATAHFVIDTSRNGSGPFDASAYAAEPYNQPEDAISALNGGGWCNPPGAGLGQVPALTSDQALLDAYLWIKIPGESDGQCDIAGGARGWDFEAYSGENWVIDDTQHFDPLWGQVDPAAGQWFPAQAAELINLANPEL